MSTGFRARLDRLRPGGRVRAIVMLRADGPGEAIGGRRSRVERQAAFEALRDSARQSLGEIDSILERFGGKRLSADPTALGSVVVEATVQGLSALADSECVKAILEDQPVSLLGKLQERP